MTTDVSSLLFIVFRWEQGNVGWGVLGSFGSAGKDEVAQGAVHSARGDGVKMVKNEKGLW
jgi:hypothetical protein